MTNKILIDRATLEQLVEAAEGLMEWQVKNVKVWHNSAYDTMDMRLNQLRAALAGAEPAGCTWTQDADFEMGDTYDSACGEKWSFIDGGPTENRVRFCQGCGKPVALIKEQP